MAKRDLQAEQYALGVFGKKNGRMPNSSQDWDAVHGIAYPGGLPEELATATSESASAAGLSTPSSGDAASTALDAPAASGQFGTDASKMNASKTALDEAQGRFSKLTGPNQAYQTLQEALKAKIGAADQKIGQGSINQKAGVTGYGSLGSSLATRATELRTEHANLQNLATTLSGTYKDQYDAAMKEIDTAASLYEFEANRFDAAEAIVQQNQNQLKLLQAQADLDATTNSKLTEYQKQTLAQNMVAAGTATDTADALRQIAQGTATNIATGSGGLVDAFPEGSQTTFTRPEKNGKSSAYWANQCGAWVNDLTGLGVGDTYKSKLDKMDSSITADNSEVGDVAIQSPDTVGIDNGHIMIIEAKFMKDGQLYYRVGEDNYKQDANGIGVITHSREVPASEVSGYARPGFKDDSYNLTTPSADSTTGMTKEEFIKQAEEKAQMTLSPEARDAAWKTYQDSQSSSADNTQKYSDAFETVVTTLGSVASQKSARAHFKDLQARGDETATKSYLNQLAKQSLSGSLMTDYTLYNTTTSEANIALGQLATFKTNGGTMDIYKTALENSKKWAVLEKDQSWVGVSQQVAQTQAQYRKALYGSSVTPSEQASGMNLFINPDDDIATVETKLRGMGEYSARWTQRTLDEQLGIPDAETATDQSFDPTTARTKYNY